MSKHISMKHFLTADQYYHVYRISHATLASQPHHHDYFQLCYVICGGIRHTSQSQSVLLGPGDVFLVPPGFSHSIRFEIAGTEIYSLSFQSNVFRSVFSQADRFLQSLWNSPHIPGQFLQVNLGPEHSRNLCELMECLIRQQAEGAVYFSAAPGLIWAMVCLLLQRHATLTENPAQISTGHSPVLRDCIAYIDRNYHQTLTPDTLSRQFGLSKSVLYSSFQEVTGLSLHKYIAKRRITEAQILIRSRPELQLSQIAALVGYRDLSTFYRNFLRICGISPSQYREQFYTEEKA